MRWLITISFLYDQYEAPTSCQFIQNVISLTGWKFELILLVEAHSFPKFPPWTTIKAYLTTYLFLCSF